MQQMLFSFVSRAFLLCLLISSQLLSSVPTDLSFFNDKPRSIAKDFYIYRYLQKPSTTSKEAWKLLEMPSRMSMKLFHAFANKLDEPGIKRVSQCLKMKLKPLLHQDDECLAIKFSMYSATTLDKQELQKVEKRLSAYPISKSLHVLYDKNPFDAMVKGDKNLFFDVFNHVGSTYREKFLDHGISKEKLQKLQKNWSLNTTISYIVTNPKLHNINK